ncbi:hypothetical protein [Brevundimonas sp. M20]|uniref:hypothetical protein n=1 Tax=Brevundimonas sp. M20 TaxID=2591463 RepID=UPI0011476ABB|nr:hypothetical protein [Brevundimonas sp. M20]QDH72311.1 hypothetical protein FKQ52_02045 [Brevundimonas sp. M20]
MKIAGRYLLPALLGGCAALTLGLLLWPQPEPASAQAPAQARFDGPTFETRPSTRLTVFPFSLGALRTEPVADAVQTPTLVGIAGSTAYLKGSDGEVIRVRSGEELDGWKLVSVRGRTVLLRGPTGDRALALFAPAPAPASNDVSGG